MDDSASNSEAEDASESPAKERPQQHSPAKDRQQHSPAKDRQQQQAAKENPKPAKEKAGAHKAEPMAPELSDVVSFLRNSKLVTLERNLAKRMRYHL